MNVLYEDSGTFKTATVVNDSENALQVEAPHGKRAKIRAKDVLLRFAEPAAAELLPQAESLARDIDTDFLWQSCSMEEFSFAELAREYCGRLPTAVEATGILIKLHSAPIYFYRKGKGRFRAAPIEIVRAGLAAVERKKQQQLQIENWKERLVRNELPKEFRPLLVDLLYKPDRNRPETKALEEACAETGLSSARLLHRCGALPSSYEYHVSRFLNEYFPRGTEFGGGHEIASVTDLPVADVLAFSLDDAATTEIDDAFSVTPLAGDRLRIGIHIAAPALGFTPDSALGAVARTRLSTVYMPGSKITMLPPTVIERFTLMQGGERAALSLYFDTRTSDFALDNFRTRVEFVPIAANLRHHAVADLDSAFISGSVPSDIPYSDDLDTLWKLAIALERARGRPIPAFERPEYTFRVEGENVTIIERRRGTPLDKLVSELMITVNSIWGKLLHDHDVAAIYRVQSGGKVRLTTSASEHQSLGASHYAWTSSPLRRYVDLVNQWQLLALLSGEPPPFSRDGNQMFGAVHDFEATHAAYDDFQRRMEHYWCLKWLKQEKTDVATAEVVRENLVRFEGLPLYVKVPSIPEFSSGTRVELEIMEIDLYDANVRCRFRKKLS